MKFVCPSCQKKYQIADEKISGKMLRMDCRECGHPISLRGEGMASNPPPSSSQAFGMARPSAVAPAPSASARPASVRPPPTPSNLPGSMSRPRSSAGLSVPAVRPSLRGNLSRAPSQLPRKDDLWHVAINHVPVGPLKKEDVARKIVSGAVTEASLAWREGFGDWRPVKEIPELAGLLRTGVRPPTLPPTPQPRSIDQRQSSEMEAEEATNIAPLQMGRGDSLLPPVFGNAPNSPAPGVSWSFPPSGPAATASRAETGAPAISLGVQSGQSAPIPSTPVVMAPEKIAERDKPRRAAPKNSSGAPLWFAIAMAFTCGIMLTWAVMQVTGNGNRASAERAPEPAAVAPPAFDPVVQDPTPVAGAPIEVTGSAPGANDAAEGNGSRSRPRPTSGPVAAAVPTASPAAAGTSRFDRFQDNGAGMAAVAVPRGQTEARGSTSERSSAQLTDVISRQRRSLQSCYEAELRRAGAGNAQQIRIDMAITVGASGTVTAAQARGPSMGDLSSCLERQVRRWRFPPGADTDQLNFPLVFAPQN